MLSRIVLRLELRLLAIFTGIIVLVWGLGQLLPPAPLSALSRPGWNRTPDIYVLDIFRGLALNLTKNGAWNEGGAVAPDGRHLAYTSFIDGNAEIYVLNLTTGTQQRLTGDMAYDGSAAWSPDGNWLAFASERGSSLDLYVIAAAGGTPRQVASTPDADSAPAWSPDSKQLAFVKSENYGSGIYITRTDGSGEPRQLTAYAGNNSAPTWSPDGKWVAFVSDQTGRMDLYLLPVACLETPDGCASSNPRPLTRLGYDRLDAPRWSADGRLYFWGQTGAKLELYALDANCDLQPGGCVPQRLTNLGRSLMLGHQQFE
ncbi:MAG TPA: hypothetical protein VHO69_19460 [Phototrophicaceae bacterium]|nr:hypothetical protein [Phototrophicaceae bacterium]